MSPDIKISAGDTLPIVEDTLYDDDGEALDLSGVGTAVQVRYRIKSQVTAEVRVPVQIIGDGPGRVRWTLTAPIAGGSYNLDWIVTYGDGSTFTRPDRHLWLQVLPAP